MKVIDDSHFPAHLLPDSDKEFNGVVDLFLRRPRLHFWPVLYTASQSSVGSWGSGPQTDHLQSPLFHVTGCQRRFFLIGLAQHVGVAQHLVPHLSAQQSVERLACHLAQNIPQSHVHAAQGTHHDISAPPVSSAIYQLPEILDLRGVTPNKYWRQEGGNEVGHCMLLAVQGSIPHSINPAVRNQLHK